MSETKQEKNENGATAPSTELSTDHNAGLLVQNNFFNSRNSFEHVQRVAKVFSQSELVPKRYQSNIGNCIIAMEMAQRIGASPLMVMQHLNVIQGTPSWSSVFLIASLNASGKFSPLRYEEDEKEGGRTRAWAVDKSGEKCYGIWVTMEMAKKEGWLSKTGSKWQSMPGLMRRYRAASFFQKQFAPEISMGFQTTEEVYDFVETVPTSIEKPNKEQERIELLLADCKTIAEVDELQKQMPEVDEQVFNLRKTEINPDWNAEPSAESEIKRLLADCVTIAEVKDLAIKNPDVDARLFQERENELVFAATKTSSENTSQLPADYNVDLQNCSDIKQVNQLHAKYLEYHGKQEFEKMTNDRKIAIGKSLTGKPVRA